MPGTEIARPAKPVRKPSYGYVIVAATFVIMLFSQGLFIVFGVFFDPLVSQFGWSRATISGAYSLSSILTGVLGIVAGWLTDKFGPRLVVAVSGLFLGLGYLLISQVNALWQFYLFYGVFVGIGMGGLWIPLLSPIVRWFTARRSLMTAIVTSGLTVGQLIAPPLISRLIGAQGWRQAYILLGSVTMGVIVILALFLRRDPGPSGKSTGTEFAAQPAKGGSLDFPFKAALRTGQFWLVAVAFFCVGVAAFSIWVHIVPYAIQLGIPGVTAANILAISGGVGIIGNFALGGYAGDKISNRWAFLLGTALMAAALFWLLFSRELWSLYLFAVVFGIGLGGMATAESPLVAELFGKTSHGLIYGTIGFSWTAGGALGPSVVGYLWDVRGNYQLAFVLCALVGLLSLLLLALLRPTKRRGGKPTLAGA